MSTVRMKGGKELDAFLSALPKKLASGAVRSSLTAAAAVIRNEARLQVADTTETGALRKAIKTGKSRVNRDGTVSIRIRPSGKHSYLANWIEYGVKPHVISVSDGEGSLKIGKNFVGAEVQHPGFAAKPFLRPALDGKLKEAVDAFGQKMRFYLKNKTGLTAPLLQADDDEY